MTPSKPLLLLLLLLLLMLKCSRSKATCVIRLSKMQQKKPSAPK
jgi:hypothetical protein